jgi:type IV secretory pathway TrbL component
MQFMKLHLTPMLGMAVGPGIYIPMFFIILASFGLLAILATLVRLELLLALLAGYPLLALGGHPITRAVAAGYLRWVVSIAVRIFFFVLLGTFASRIGHIFLEQAEANVRWYTSPIVTLAPLPAFVMLAILAVAVTRISREITAGFNWHPGPWDVGHGLREEK